MARAHVYSMSDKTGKINRNTRKEGGIDMNTLNIIHTYIITALLCLMSYWHGNSEYGWRKAGLIMNLILGFVFAVLAIKLPIFL